jgi:hypothetical protein
MSQAKRASKGMRRNKAVSVVGIAGVSLAMADGGASASTSGALADIPQNTGPRQLVTLGEEEIFDVNLSTFYVFDKENSQSRQMGVQTAFRGCGGCRGCGGRGCGGCRGCGGRGCGVGWRGCGGGCGGCGVGWGGCGVGWGGCGCCLSWGACRVC